MLAADDLRGTDSALAAPWNVGPETALRAKHSHSAAALGLQASSYREEEARRHADPWFHPAWCESHESSESSLAAPRQCRRSDRNAHRNTWSRNALPDQCQILAAVD